MNANTIDREALERICREHAETRELMTTLMRMLAEKNGPASQVYRLMKMLNDHLVEHFRTEEETGVFNNLTSSVPTAQPSTRELLDEHPKFLKRMDELLDGSNHPRFTRMQWLDLEDRFRDFSNDLMHHEAHENQLVERAYTDGDFESGD